MRKPFLAALAVLALCACHDSLVPLDSPSKGVIDPRLLGRWIWAPEPSENETVFMELEVRAASEHEYLAELREHRPYKAVKTDRYRAFSSTVGGRAFLNIQGLKDEAKPEGYFLGALEFPADDAFTLALVNSDKAMEKLADSKALRRYVQARLSAEGFLQKPVRFKRGPKE